VALGRIRGADWQRRWHVGAVRGLLFALLGFLTALTVEEVATRPAQAAPSMWSVTPSPNVGSGDELASVSCTESVFCAAAGSYDGGDGTLTELWDGTSWQVTRSPSPGGDPDELFGVSCFSTSSCMAVGWYYDVSTADYHTLAEYWDGRSWSLTATPSPSVQSVLYAVSCTGANRCTGVGYEDAGSGFATLVESWTGSTWSIVPSPDKGPYNSVLQSVSCLNASTCAAVGWFDGASRSSTLVELWNGSVWSVVPSPDVSSGNNELLSVSCTDAMSCAAVGFYGAGFGPPLSLIETWDGSIWSVGAAETVGQPSSQLQSVSCTFTTNCVAVGYYDNHHGNLRTLVGSLGQSGWGLTPSPGPRAVDDLFGVSCVGSTSCQAVGYDGSGSLVSQETLVEAGSG
jgi:hypothetical protein